MFSGLRYDTDEENWQEQASSLDESALAVQQQSMDVSEPSEHSRFSQTMREWVTEQGSEDAFRKMLVKHSTQAHVVSSLYLRDGKHSEARFIRQERDAWMLLEILVNSRRREPDENGSGGPDTDATVLADAFGRSREVQRLHLLIRWMHLNHADRAARFLVRKSDMIARSNSGSDLLGGDDIDAQIIWDQLRAGALHFHPIDFDQPETDDMSKRLQDLFQDSPHAWRYASLSGGRPFTVESTLRIGNAHRARWKRASRTLAASSDASFIERAMYYVVSGGEIPQEVTNALRFDTETKLWSALRGLEEFWSDCVLYRYHCEALDWTKPKLVNSTRASSRQKLTIRGVTKAEMDRGADESLIDRRFFHLATGEEVVDDATLGTVIMKVFRNAAGLSEPLHSGTIPPVAASSGKDDLFFFRIVHAMLSGKLNEQIQEELEANTKRSAHEGSKLRFLANLAFFTHNYDREYDLVAHITCSEATMRACLRRYLDYLLEVASDASSMGSSPNPAFPALVFDVVSYCEALDEEARLAVFKTCLQLTTISLQDEQRMQLLELMLAIQENAGLNIFITMIPFEEEQRRLAWNQVFSRAKEHPECARRRRAHMPFPLSDSEQWRQTWAKDIELLRWSALLCQLVNPASADAIQLMLMQGNVLVREAVQSYLQLPSSIPSPSRHRMHNTEEARVLDWKKGQVALFCMAQVPLNAVDSGRGKIHDLLLQFQAWSLLFTAWESVALSERELAEVEERAGIYEEQVRKARDPEKLRLLQQQRDEDVHGWTSEEDLELQSSPHNLPAIAHSLREALVRALKAPFPTADKAALKLRNEYAGKLALETFKRLDAIATVAERLRLQVSLSGLTSLHRECIRLADVLSEEAGRRMGQATEEGGEELAHMNEFKKQVKECLLVIEKAAQRLIRTSDTPFTGIQ